MPATTVVVVTYQSANDVDRCFSSLRQALAGSPAAHVVAIDNASADGTLARLRAAHPWVEAIALPANAGFAAAANVGLRRARERGDEFAFLLNPDTEVDPEFLARALAAAGESASIGAVQSLLLLDPERELVDSAGNAQHFLGFGFCRDHRRPLRQLELTRRPIAFASGAACLLRCAALERIGELDEALFLYGEDVDLGWRLRLAGYSCVLAPDSVVYHRHEFQRHPAKPFHLELARLRTLLKNSAGRTLAVLSPLLVLCEAALFVVAARQGWAGQKVRAWRALLGRDARRALRADRRVVQATRRVSDADLAADLAGRLDQPGVTGPVVRRLINPVLAALWAVARRLL